MRRQLIQFGVIGVTAMVVHLLVVVALVSLNIPPLAANVVAFSVAFQVSYWGHRHWTFNARTLRHRQTLPRFVSVAGFGFALNEFSFFLLLRFTTLDYRIALTTVLTMVAISTFFLNRQWAFRKHETDNPLRG